MRSKLAWAWWLGLLVGLCGACGEDEPTPATQVVVSVTSDFDPGSELTRIEMTLSDRAGDDVVGMREFAVVAEDPADGQYTLPLTFSIGKGEEASFLLVVTGYGPRGTDDEEEKIVEQKAIASFQDGAALLLKVFLGRICRENFCDDDETQVCYPAATEDVEQGFCGDIMAFGPDELERIDVNDPPDFSLWPPGVGPDGGQPRDAGPEPDGGFDAGCTGDNCCRSDRDCDDLMYCTENVCDEGTGECSNPPYVCPDDANACTFPVTCDEDADECPAPVFDETSITSGEHCGASATSACVPCTDDATRTATCLAGSCSFVCFDGLFEVDGDLGNGCECTFMSAVDDEDDAALDTNCDGADGEVDGTRFVYVTPAGAGAMDGSSPADAATLLAAFTIAGTTTRNRLLLASGDYLISSQLQAADGMVMFGGYAPDFRSRSGVSQVLASSASALLILNAVVGVTIDSVDFTTASQTTPAGAYTHTIDVNNSTNVELSRLTVTAGSGAAGALGTTGGIGTNTVGLGGAGSNAPNTTTGGAGGSSAGAQGAGGDGGPGGAIVGGVPQTGVQGSNGTLTGTGSCGVGSLGGPGDSPSCIVGNYLYEGNPGTAGRPGCPGPTGSNGAGGTGAGTVAGDGSWTPAVAAAGGAGSTGGSGAGGGGGGGITCNGASSGGGGGEGGAGGGGGAPGGGGGAGGASIGILVRLSSIRVSDLTIATATGGMGGTGGSGGVGGTGADGGIGGQGLNAGSNPTMRGGQGGKGGLGGTGGRGGCGGGGAGGPSVGIFGSAGTVISGTPTYQAGTGGSPGAACAAGGGNAGAMGMALDTVGF